MPTTSAYLHIPFCRRRCFYCDFPVRVVGDQRHGGNSLAIAQYVEAICEEIRLTPHPYLDESLGKRLNEQPDERRFVPTDGGGLHTVFLGGGTPSLLTVEQLSQILETLRSHIGIAETAEISIEMDPGTFDLAQVQGYRAAGVNRISLGSQAFQPHLLEACGRTHNVEDIYDAVDLLRQAHVENFSLDLISGLPSQTIADWQASLEKVLAIAPAHVSAYDMVLEPNTVFGKRYEPGGESAQPNSPLPADNTAADMYRLAQATLTAAGYDHYEVSNYAKPGFQCRHNRVYWEMKPYYAFGMGAASFVDGARFSRPRTTRSYYEWLATAKEQVKPGDSVEKVFGDRLDTMDELLETLMVGMRLVEGVSLGMIQRRFGTEAKDTIIRALIPFQKRGQVVLDTNPQTTSQSLSHPDGEQLRFTDPEGFLFSNQVLATLFDALETDQ